MRLENWSITLLGVRIKLPSRGFPVLSALCTDTPLARMETASAPHVSRVWMQKLDPLQLGVDLSTSLERLIPLTRRLPLRQRAGVS